MTRPRRSAGCSLLRGLVLLLLATPALARGTAADAKYGSLDALLAAFRSSPGFSAHFREEKRLSLLAAPLISKGTLYYQRPGLLARHISAPSPSITILEPQRVRVFDGKRWSQLDLSSKPLVRAFVEGFARILAGDRVVLERLYRLGFRRHGKGWLVVLVPRRPPLSKVIKRLEISGRGLSLQTLRVLEKGGDSSTMTFEKVEPRRRFSAQERARFFPRGPR